MKTEKTTLGEVRMLRKDASVDALVARLGPFLLVEKPADALEARALSRLADKTTRVIPKGQRLPEYVRILVQFDDLEVLSAGKVAGDAVLHLGRLPESDIVLEHPSVSKRHAELRWSGSRCMVVDLGSSNGTHVNGVRISDAVELRDADLIGFGDTRYCYVLTTSLYRALLGPEVVPGAPAVNAVRATELGVAGRREVVHLPEASSGPTRPGMAQYPGHVHAEPGRGAARTFTPPPGLPAAPRSPTPPPVAPVTRPPPRTMTAPEGLPAQAERAPEPGRGRPRTTGNRPALAQPAPVTMPPPQPAGIPQTTVIDRPSATPGARRGLPKPDRSDERTQLAPPPEGPDGVDEQEDVRTRLVRSPAITVDDEPTEAPDEPTQPRAPPPKRKR